MGNQKAKQPVPPAICKNCSEVSPVNRRCSDEICVKLMIEMEDLSNTTKLLGKMKRESSFTTRHPYGGNDLEWLLRSYPSGHEMSKGNHIGLYIILVNSQQVALEGEYQMYVLNRKGDISAEYHAKALFHAGKHYGKGDFLDKGTLRKKLSSRKNANAFIVVELTVSARSKSKEFDKSNERGRLSSELQQDFKHLYESQHGTDLKLIVGAEKHEFQVHKTVLIARNHVFRAMLAGKTKESLQGLVEIPDLKPEAVDVILRYMYFGLEQVEERQAEVVFEAADKYGMETLRNRCETLLCDTLTVENVFRRLDLADRHLANFRLRPLALKFLLKHLDQVVGSDEWQSLVLTRVDLITEIFEMLAKPEIKPKILFLDMKYCV